MPGPSTRAWWTGELARETVSSLNARASMSILVGEARHSRRLLAFLDAPEVAQTGHPKTVRRAI
jgi:hypothetical protein